MCPYLELTQVITSQFNNLILRFCLPFFEGLNLHHFWYYKLTDTGVITFIGSQAEWMELFAAENFFNTYPFFCHPKYHQAGVSIRKDVQNQSLIKIGKSWEKKYGTHQCLVITNNHLFGIEEFGFLSRSACDAQTEIFINELPLFHFFIRKFKEKEKLLSKLEDFQINVANLIGPSFYQDRVLKLKRCDRRALLEKIEGKREKPLTLRESEVLQLVLQGYSAGKIATQVYLSKRTVEHHIERIKEKLGCGSKAELIQKGLELEKFSYF